MEEIGQSCGVVSRKVERSTCSYCLYKLVARKIVCIFKRCATRLVSLVMVTVSVEYVVF